MSGTVAIIPFRGTPTAKSRLAARFSAEQRERIARHVLSHVLTEIAGSGVVDHLLVVTSDREPPSIPIGLVDRVTVLRQPPQRAGLNAAIALGREAAMARGDRRLLIVLPDLPILTRDDIQLMLAEDDAVVLAPDRHGTGTNALAIDLAETSAGFAFGFGDRSAPRHLAEARRLGFDPVTVVADGFRHDLDTPDDWDSLPDPTRRALLVAIQQPAPVG
jgi:2-phospho-L-lactate guanylyltransferase